LDKDVTWLSRHDGSPAVFFNAAIQQKQPVTLHPIVIVIGLPEIVPVPESFEPLEVQLNEPLRLSSQVNAPVPPESDFISKVPEQVVPLLEVIVNGAVVFIPASPDPVNVSNPSESRPDTGMVAEQAAIRVSKEAATIGPILFLFIYF
jgi:hypothetical protein